MKTAEFPPTIIRASAGSGKTHQLASRFLGLLFCGERPERILATTFTRKAAGEILDRVVLRLAQAACADEERKKLAAALGKKQLSREQSLEVLSAALRELHTLRVGTLDSFFMQVAGSFSLELGLPPGWRIGEELEDAALREEAVEAVLAGDDKNSLPALFHLLTKGEANRGVAELMLDAVSNLYGVYRETAESAWRKIPQPPILGEKQLHELITAINNFDLTDQDKRMAAARNQGCELAAAGEWLEMAGKGICYKVLTEENTFFKKPIPAGLVRLYQSLLGHVKGVFLTQLARQTEATWELLHRFDQEFQSLKQQRRTLRFDEVTFALAGAAEILGLERFQFRLDGGVEHLLLDEFQDTSLAQWQVLRPLAKRITGKTGDGTFFCVGDIKQAIYGWRGGLAEIFDALQTELTGLQRAELACSRRSSQPVIDAVNQVFKQMAQHPELEDYQSSVSAWSQAYPPHTTALDKLPGFVTLETSPLQEVEEDVTTLMCRFAAQRVAELTRQAPHRAIGVLVRRNVMIGRIIYLLREMGVAASEEGGNPLTDSPAVELIQSLLKIADHPSDTAARFHISNSPLAAEIGLPNYADDGAARRLSATLRRELLEGGYGPAAFRWSQFLAASCNQRDLNRLQQLVELAFDFQAESTLRTADFVALIEQHRAADPSGAKVRVMTIHQSKGLEFDIVVLPELHGRILGQTPQFAVGRSRPGQPVEIVCRSADKKIRNLLPTDLQELFQKDRERRVSEQLCLLYVGMTRAIHALHLLIPAPGLTKSGPGKLPKTAAGLLRAALTAGEHLEPNQTAYKHGNPDWNQQMKDDPGHARPPGPPATADGKPVAPIQFLPRKDRRRNLERARPSGLEGGSRFSLGSLFAESSPGALVYGTLIHAWLELVDWKEDGWPSEARLRETAQQLASQIPMVASQIDDRLKDFQDILARPAVAQTLSREFYQSPTRIGWPAAAARDWPSGVIELEARQERTFAILDAGQIVQGSIDRLVLLRGGGKLIGADVVDFKTDQVSSDKALAAKVAFYRPQMEAYLRAAARLTRLPADRITGRLLFVSTGQVVPI